jgi:hypothetical protein
MLPIAGAIATSAMSAHAARDLMVLTLMVLTLIVLTFIVMTLIE